MMEVMHGVGSNLFHRSRALWLVALSLAGALLPVGPGSFVAPVAAESPVGATVSVLVAPVEVAPIEVGVFAVAVDKQTLHQGDIVRTGPGGIALLTFFDGSESQLGAETTVQIEQVEANPAPQIALFQAAGVTVNHIVPMPAGGSFRTDTSSAAGLVRGTSYIVIVADGSQDDQAPAPTSIVLLTDRNGHVGRVDVAAKGSITPPVQLGNAGDAAIAAAWNTTAAALEPSSLAQLEAVAHVRNDETASRTTEQQARAIAAKLALPVVATPRAAVRVDEVAPAREATAAEDRTSKSDTPTPRATPERHEIAPKSDKAPTGQAASAPRADPSSGAASARRSLRPTAAPVATTTSRAGDQGSKSKDDNGAKKP